MKYLKKTFSSNSQRQEILVLPFILCLQKMGEERKLEIVLCVCVYMCVSCVEERHKQKQKLF